MSDESKSLEKEFIADAAKMVIGLAQRCRNLNSAAARHTLDAAEARLAKEYELQGLAIDKARELAREIITPARALVFSSAQTKAGTVPKKA